MEKDSLINKNEVFRLISNLDDLSSDFNNKMHALLKSIQ